MTLRSISVFLPVSITEWILGEELVEDFNDLVYLVLWNQCKERVVSRGLLPVARRCRGGKSKFGNRQDCCELLRSILRISGGVG